ncbi:winged helix-turn-helix transcription repressor, HrcA DNA-binding family protein [Clostridium baratii str. Sullivan]|uniref:Winged helix-turn-helix transcription repressor, HrcA DNA-binding family protein n=1 Tax=Clostridium baratii str. Sullivan TaxID=1415775 RepID=A0A0A7FWE3_9CLOT|nr:WYL domain-containing transcriptional regulator [Clostridium baratii]AIY83954.1 winged helix-turn-helix transcription repressor, HrcA DNA-binding family protein [Clostridium baratii str. Sullivan]
MSKLNNIIRMMFMLKSGRVIKKKELAEKLGVNEKQVLRYKNALDEVFNIVSVPGPSGGYKLEDTYFPFKEVLSEEEIMSLKFILKRMDFGDEEEEKYNNILDKINFSILNSENEYKGDIIPYSRRNGDINKLKEIEMKIYEAILEKKKIIIDYVNNQNKASSREVLPYKHFIYRGEPYLIAYCLKRNEIRFFKFIRIDNCIITSFTFERTIDIEKEIKDMKEKKIGIFYGEEYDLELEISPPMANSVRERIWVDDQEIIELPDGKILFRAKMGGGHSVISWILTMKEFVKINKPDKLKEDVINTLEKMLDNHKK